MSGAKEFHSAKVASIAAAVRERASQGATSHISKGGVPHFVPLPGDKRSAGKPIDVSSLDAVLDVDPEKMICVTEPGVTFAELVDATLPFGVAPAVVPELEGITVGGAVAGCSVESMSYEYGGFHDNCLEYEIVTGTGEVLVCSPESEPLLFEMMHGSYGTLALLTKVTFKLVPAKPFVKMDYRVYGSIGEFNAAMKAACDGDEHELVDGIIHGPDQHVLCLGNFVDETPYTSDYRWLDIFYKSTLTRSEDYLRTQDYFFRYDAECHWMTKAIPPLEWKPVRFAVGKVFLGSSNLIQWSRRLERVLSLKKRPDVVCDVFIPASRFEEFFDWYARDFVFYPLWIVPYQPKKVYPWIADDLAARMNGEMFIDCAIYGKPNGGAVDYSRLLEEKVFELNGLKTLISRNHYSDERFWQVYNEANYLQAKGRLDPSRVFPDLRETFARVE